MFRFAIVKCTNAKALWAYLPGNYVIVSGIDPEYLVGGIDEAGWTLDDYVLPRLASGLHFGREVSDIEAVDFIRAQNV